MPGGQARMIQMLAVLSDIQQRRRAQDLAERQAEEQKSQFARSMGFQEKSAEYKKVGDLLDAIAKSSTESRNALTELGTSLGLDAQSIAALAHYGQTAPESMDVFTNKTAQQGYREQAPQVQAQMRQEGAARATTGMNMGGMAMSGLQNIMALGGNKEAMQTQFGPQGLAALVQGFMQRVATNQTPVQAAVDQSQQQQGLVPQMARIQAGTQMTAPQAGQLALGNRQATTGEGNLAAQWAQINQQGMYQANMTAINQLEAMAKAQAASGANNFGGIKTDDFIQGMGRLRELRNDMANGKSNDAQRMRAIAEYNILTQRLGVSRQLGIGDASKAPDDAGFFSRMVSPSNPTPQSVMPQNPYPTNPLLAPPQNPINWFGRP